MKTDGNICLFCGDPGAQRRELSHFVDSGSIYSVQACGRCVVEHEISDESKETKKTWVLTAYGAAHMLRKIGLN